MGADARRKEARKRKFDGNSSTDLENADSKLEDDASVAIEPSKKRSKRNTSSRSRSQDSAVDLDKKGSAPNITEVAAKKQDTAPIKAQRFIVFIGSSPFNRTNLDLDSHASNLGNLPYTATDDSIKKHFAKVQPKSIRHRTEKESGKSKGFAFLEFEAYDRMKTCLKNFHGSEFDDGISAARKLNVELTVGGGGGKSKDRKSKLLDKNERLKEQRERRALEDEKLANEGEKNDSNKSGRSNSRLEKDKDKKTEEGAQPVMPLDNGNIHPSRRNRMAT